ncbi:MAG: CheR family methyltransferase [Planctomycetota bacterium]
MSMFTAGDLDYCRQLVHQVAGLLLDERKDYLFETRLRVVVDDYGFGGTAQLVEALKRPASGELRARVVDAMTTNETSFFRDEHPFEALREFVLPSLLEAGGRRSMDIWSAASSTGQEAYSLAMLLRENVPEPYVSRARIRATDLSLRVLAQARAGIYSDVEVQRGLSPSLRERYFERDGRCWRVQPPLRRMVEFGEFNLTGSWANVGQMDVVFLRNVLIYFDVATKQRILGELRRVLRPDGLLCLGAAETVLGIRDDFVPVRLGRATFYRPA